MITIRGDLAEVTFDRFGLEQYELFLRAKRLPESQVSFDREADRYVLTTPARFADRLGVDVPTATAVKPTELAPHLFDYQAWSVSLALPAKRFALWLDTGLGKTACFLEWARQVQGRTGGRVLILSPLGVIPQTREAAQQWYGDAKTPTWQLQDGGLPILHLRHRADLIAWAREGGSCDVAIANYDQFIPGEIPELRHLAGLVADESSLLRAGGGVIKWNLIKSARGIEYKLSCTATPAPNDAMEYASQASFLEKLRTEGEILWTYFSKDKRGDWYIKPHAKQAFYRFMASWSLYLRDPARFGFNDILATLPAPEIMEERIVLTDEQRVLMTELLVRSGKGMFGDDRLGVQERSRLAQLARGFLYGRDAAGRRTVQRVEALKPRRVAELIREEVAAGRPTLAWTTFDEEGEIVLEHLREAPIPTAILTGSQTDLQRAELLARFRSGDIGCLISKPQLLGFGLNLQFVKSMVFSGFDDSFERVYQAIRRAYRFGQTDAVRVFWPYVPELEGMVFDNIRAKEARFLEEVAAQEEHYRRALADELRGVAA